MMTLHAPAPRRPIPLLRRRGHAHSSSLSSSSGSGSHAALLGVTSASTFASAPVSRAPSSRSTAHAAAQPPCTPPREPRRSVAAQLEDAATDSEATPTRTRAVDGSSALGPPEHSERIARAASPMLLPPLSPSTLHLEALRRSASPAGRAGAASDESSSRCTSAAPTTAPSSPAPSSGLAAMHPHTPRAAFGLAQVHSPIPRDWTLNPLARRRLDAVFLEAGARADAAVKHSS